MDIIKTPEAVNGSTYIIQASFTDEDGIAVVPESIVWSLTDINGNIINSRDDVSITPGSEVDIILSGDDLLVFDGLERIITIEAVYESAISIDPLPLVQQAKFTIDEFANEV